MSEPTLIELIEQRKLLKRYYGELCMDGLDKTSIALGVRQEIALISDKIRRIEAATKIAK